MFFSICVAEGRMSISCAVHPIAAIRRRACPSVRSLAANEIAEAGLAHALLDESLEIDIGAHNLRCIAEAARFGEASAVLVDQRVAIPREIGGRFAGSGGGVHVGGEASRGLIAD